MALFNAFEEAIDLSFWKELCEKQGTLSHYKRGEYFVRSGEILKDVGWIQKGGFKHSIIDDSGVEKTVGFVFDGSILANYLSVMKRNLMPTDIIALEDSEVYTVPASMIRSRLLEDPDLNVQLLENMFEQAYCHILNDYRFTPEQRYIKLIDRYPQLLELVTLSEIASYLNISRRHLYRIRESIANPLQ